MCNLFCFELCFLLPYVVCVAILGSNIVGQEEVVVRVEEGRTRGREVFLELFYWLLSYKSVFKLFDFSMARYKAALVCLLTIFACILFKDGPLHDR